jgi:hypothetical protein
MNEADAGQTQFEQPDPLEGVSPEEFARRKRALEDFIGLSKHIPNELRAKLELTLSAEAKPHVLSLQLLAIQYGRALQREEEVSEQLLTYKARNNGEFGAKPSKLLNSMLYKAKDDFDPKSILVVPGHALPKKAGEE